jgi:hypothetical protein
MYRYTVMYLLKINKIILKNAGDFYRYSTVTCVYCGVVLFFIAMTILLMLINEQIFFLFPIAVHNVFNFM